MLQSIRKGSRTWVGVILAGFMMLLFGVWGLEDFIRGGFNQGSTVITVGKVEVNGIEFQNRYQPAVTDYQRQYRQRTGRNIIINYETAKRLGIINQVALGFIQNAIYQQETARLGLSVSDKVIQQELYSVPQFRGPTGQFDRTRFELYLQQAQITQDRLFQDLALQTSRRFLLTSVGNFETAPKSYLERLYKFRNERRVAEVVTIDASSVQDPPSPTDADLQAYVDAHKAAFTAPAYRSVQAIIVRPEDIYKRIKIDSAEVKKVYEADKAAKYTSPEKREIHQILFSSEADAKKAYAALVGGKSFEAVAKEFSKNGAINLGLQEKGGIPIAVLRDASFSLKKDQVSDPIKSGLGWHIVKVIDVEPSKVKPLEAVEAGIVEDIRKRKAVPLLTNIREQLDDQLGGGFKFAEIAKRLDLKLVDMPALDAQGQDGDGRKVEGLPPTLLGAAFRLKKDEVGDITDMQGGGFYVVRVGSITPSQVPALDKIRTRATIEWRRAERLKLAKKKAEEMAAKVRAGTKLEDVAEEEKLEVKVTQPQARGAYDPSGKLDGTLETEVFKAKLNGIIVAKVPGGWAVAQVTQITPADMKGAEKEIATMATAFKKSEEEAALVAFTETLRKRYEVNINLEAIDAIFQQRGNNYPRR